MTQDLKREELADFLRSRRAQLQPEDLGLARSKRRRSGGLRQDEVAWLAGVSHSWYAWLEQGREINVSLDVLNSLARVLRLSPVEARYLRDLANPQAENADSTANVVAPELLRFIESQTWSPATITDAAWNILAWNQANTVFFGDCATIPIERRNKLRIVFTEPSARELVEDWESYAKSMLEQFRMAYGMAEGERSLDIVAELQAISPEFAQWWSEHSVRASFTGRYSFLHPVCGKMCFENNAFQSSAHPQLFVNVYVPVGETLDKMKSLLEQNNP